MHDVRQLQQVVWQPFTPKGVAGFAHGSLGRLLMVQFLVALVAAGAVMWTIATAWFPVISQAIAKLPPEGEIRSGILGRNGASPEQLSGNRFLAITVDVAAEGTARGSAHINVEFRRESLRVYSLLGYLEAPYSHLFIFAFNRTELEPWWGAWGPAILAIVGMLVVVCLMLTWWLLAIIYCFVPLIGAYFLNRDLSLPASWRLSGAAVLPGALFMSAGIICYGLGWFDLLRLGVAVALHFVIGWLYLLLAPFRLPYRAAASPGKSNPFLPETAKDNASKEA